MWSLPSVLERTTYRWGLRRRNSIPSLQASYVMMKVRLGFTEPLVWRCSFSMYLCSWQRQILVLSWLHCTTLDRKRVSRSGQERPRTLTTWLTMSLFSQCSCDCSNRRDWCCLCHDRGGGSQHQTVVKWPTIGCINTFIVASGAAVFIITAVKSYATWCLEWNRDSEKLKIAGSRTAVFLPLRTNRSTVMITSTLSQSSAFAVEHQRAYPNDRNCCYHSFGSMMSSSNWNGLTWHVLVLNSPSAYCTGHRHAAHHNCLVHVTIRQELEHS